MSWPSVPRFGMYSLIILQATQPHLASHAALQGASRPAPMSDFALGLQTSAALQETGPVSSSSHKAELAQHGQLCNAIAVSSRTNPLLGGGQRCAGAGPRL